MCLLSVCARALLFNYCSAGQAWRNVSQNENWLFGHNVFELKCTIIRGQSKECCDNIIARVKAFLDRCRTKFALPEFSPHSQSS